MWHDHKTVLPKPEQVPENLEAAFSKNAQAALFFPSPPHLSVWVVLQARGLNLKAFEERFLFSYIPHNTGSRDKEAEAWYLVLEIGVFPTKP